MFELFRIFLHNLSLSRKLRVFYWSFLKILPVFMLFFARNCSNFYLLILMYLTRLFELCPVVLSMGSIFVVFLFSLLVKSQVLLTWSLNLSHCSLSFEETLAKFDWFWKSIVLSTDRLLISLCLLLIDNRSFSFLWPEQLNCFCCLRLWLLWVAKQS